jgi:hypothetical protein
MRRIAFAAICLMSAMLPAGGAWAQAKVLTAPDAAPEKKAPDTAGNDRFIFEEVDEGILRLDTQAGTVSICGRGEAGWVCRSIPDDRQAFDAEVGRLQTENQALKDRLAAEKSAESSKPSITGTIPPAERKSVPEALGPKAPGPEAQAPAPVPPPAVVPPAASSPQPPSVAEAKAPLNPVHRLWQRLVEMMAGLRAELAKKT